MLTAIVTQYGGLGFGVVVARLLLTSSTRHVFRLAQWRAALLTDTIPRTLLSPLAFVNNSALTTRRVSPTFIRNALVEIRRRFDLFALATPLRAPAIVFQVLPSRWAYQGNRIRELE